ncbi:MAG TPA: D-alanyl-D-alanine carboxypeptidase family protein [Thermoanaerobaculia bacterium]|nr:D-alanyl-D-alanine carboxypeptidase family protein [Thermoanaerobaculia bacterium]
MIPGRSLAAALFLAGVLAPAASWALTPAPPYRSAIVFDPAGGEVLYEYRAHVPYPTASMVKMMTALVVMDHVRSGAVGWDEVVEVTHRASRVGGSRVYLEPGELFTVGDLVAAVMVKSANDAAYALAEAVSGSAEAFVREMNDKGHELGLEASRFYTPHGLPPERPGQQNDVMTARDLAFVGAAVLREPRLRELARTRSLPFRDGELELRSSNHLLRNWDEAIGVKTGWTSQADFCLTAAASRHGRELIAVVQGATRKQESFAAARRLLEEGFSRYRLVTLVRAGERLSRPVPVAGGSRDSVPVVALESVRVLVRDDRRAEGLPVVLGRRLEAPVAAGEPAGTAVFRYDDRLAARVPVAAAEPVERLPWWQRLWRRLAAFVTA